MSIFGLLCIPFMRALLGPPACQLSIGYLLKLNESSLAGVLMTDQELMLIYTLLGKL